MAVDVTKQPVTLSLMTTTAPSDWFARSRLGLFLHWGLHSLAARHERVKNYEKLDNAHYRRYFEHFWPFKHVHLRGLAGRVAYAQFLHDASEVQIRSAATEIHAGLNAASPEGAVTLELPTIKLPVEVPVIELFLP
jgi:hypothetical protein